MTQLTSQFIAALVSAAVSFGTVYPDINVSPAPDKLYNYAQRNTEQSSSIAQGSNMSAGIVVIDRAKGNKMTTNDTPAHTQYQLQTLAKLPIIMHAVRVDDAVSKGENPDSISMIQGFSAESTDAMWKKYGGVSIIQDIAERYNLQETTAKADWRETTMSAVDVGRLIRRFMDDKEVSAQEKKWVLDLLKTAPLNVSGEDMSWGIPSAMNVSEENSDAEGVVWSQGWSPSGQEPMVRHTAGMVGEGYRFIVVVMGQVPENTSNDDANRISTQTAQELISGGGNANGNGGITLGSEDNGDDIKDFTSKNQKYM